MEKLHFTVEINAPQSVVWDKLWGDTTYPQWTAAFCEGSKAETDWKEGSKVLFTDGKGNGMVSRIAAKRPDTFMSFEHLGEVKDGVEDITSDRVKNWAGAHENYTLTASGNTTSLQIDMDSNEEFKAYFEKTWPTALQKLKELAEK